MVLQFRIPEIPTEDACEMMIDGILRNERIFTIPSSYFLYLLQFIKWVNQFKFTYYVYEFQFYLFSKELKIS